MVPTIKKKTISRFLLLTPNCIDDWMFLLIFYSPFVFVVTISLRIFWEHIQTLCFDFVFDFIFPLCVRFYVSTDSPLCSFCIKTMDCNGRAELVYCSLNSELHLAHYFFLYFFYLEYREIGWMAVNIGVTQMKGCWKGAGYRFAKTK